MLDADDAVTWVAKFSKVALGALGIVFVLWLMARLSEALLANSLYSWFFQKIRKAAGFPDLLSGALAVWLTAGAIMLLPSTLYGLLWPGTKNSAVFTVAFVISLWFVGLYLLQQPREGYLFNPITGHARFRYARLPAPECKIELFPVGYNYHPRYNLKLEDVTATIAAEYEQQRQAGAAGCGAPAAAVWWRFDRAPERAATKPPLTSWNSSYSSPIRPLDMAFEGAGVRNDKTVLCLAVRAPAQASDGLLLPATGAYITDQAGTRYNLEEDRGSYPETGRRLVEENEVYRYDLLFRKMAGQPALLHLHHPQFEPVALDFASASEKQTEKVTSVGRLQLSFSPDPVLRNNAGQWHYTVGLRSQTEAAVELTAITIDNVDYTPQLLPRLAGGRISGYNYIDATAAFEQTPQGLVFVSEPVPHVLAPGKPVIIRRYVSVAIGHSSGVIIRRPALIQIWRLTGRDEHGHSDLHWSGSVSLAQ